MTPTRRTLLVAPFALALPARADVPGTVLLLRHAQTDPGTGDPPGFVAGRCDTQRNLNADGRAQARRLGPQLATRGWVPAVVRSSAWCRCLDTGQLAFGQAEPWAPLDSFFDDRSTADARTALLADALAALAPGRVEAWVTHQVNITAYTGEYPAPGETFILQAASGRTPRIVERLRA